MRDVVVGEDPDELVNKQLGEWLAENLSAKRLALANNFPFMRRAVAVESIQATSMQNGAIGAVPFLPGADMPLMTANQMKMVLQIAAAYGQPLTGKRVRELAGVLGGAFALRAIARTLLDFIPGFGWAIAGGDRLQRHPRDGLRRARVLRGRRYGRGARREDARDSRAAAHRAPRRAASWWTPSRSRTSSSLRRRSSCLRRSAKAAGGDRGVAPVTSCVVVGPARAAAVAGRASFPLHRPRVGRPSRRRRELPRGAAVSRHLRGRTGQPGDRDPLRHPERPRRRRRRARLRAVDRPGRSAPRARDPAALARERHAALRVRPARHHAALRAHRDQRARGARPRGYPAARGGAEVGTARGRWRSRASTTPSRLRRSSTRS